jgi:hypothetical protein
MNAFITAPIVKALLLAQAAGPSLNISWAIVIFAILIGLALTLSPSRRTYEVKRPKDE